MGEQGLVCLLKTHLKESWTIWYADPLIKILWHTLLFQFMTRKTKRCQMLIN